MKMDYIIITPVKNEENFLPAVADAVVQQSIIPKLWVIVDDGSSDSTPQIIAHLQSQYTWINTIRLPESERNLKFRYPFVCVSGFDYAINYCNKHLIQIDYIALLDADTVLEHDYYKKIFSQFSQDDKLGVASGGIYHEGEGEIKWRGTLESLPSGSGRVWRKACFFDTGGYVVETSPDSISNVKAKLRGWKIRQFKDIIAVEKRKTSGAEGLWKGYVINGWKAYYLDKHPLLVIINCFLYSTKKPYYLGIAYLYGFIKSVLQREDKIQDPEIRTYNRKKRLYEYL